MEIPVADAIWNPQVAIEEVKKDGDIKTPFVLLLIASIVAAIAGAISAYSLAGKGLIAKALGKAGVSPSVGWLAVGAFLIVLIGGLLSAFYYMLVMKALNTKYSYFAGIGTIAMTAMPASIGYLVLSILGLGGTIGAVIGLIIAVAFIALAVGTLYNATKIFFETDMITAFVGVSAFIMTMAIMVWPLIFRVISRVAASS